MQPKIIVDDKNAHFVPKLQWAGKNARYVGKLKKGKKKGKRKSYCLGGNLGGFPH